MIIEQSRQRVGRHRAEVPDDQVRPGGIEVVGREGRRHANARHRRRLRPTDASHRVFEDHAPGRHDAEEVGGAQVKIRCRLATRDLAGVDDCLKRLAKT